MLDFFHFSKEKKINQTDFKIKLYLILRTSIKSVLNFTANYWKS